MEDKDTREFDDKDTEVVDAQVIEPPQDADDNDDEYEKVCFVCRRPESKTGKMITMQGNLHICPEDVYKRQAEGCGRYAEPAHQGQRDRH